MCAQGGFSPLHMATRSNRKDFLEILLLNGSDKDAKSVVSELILNNNIGYLYFGVSAILYSD